MTKLLAVLALVFFSLSVTVALAGDVDVSGYTRRDGTYVAPHVRSAPNNTRSDNYGRPSASDRAYSVPAQRRDYDNDGIGNQYDSDDDNDGIGDDNE